MRCICKKKKKKEMQLKNRIFLPNTENLAIKKSKPVVFSIVSEN